LQQQQEDEDDDFELVKIDNLFPDFNYKEHAKK